MKATILAHPSAGQNTDVHGLCSFSRSGFPENSQPALLTLSTDSLSATGTSKSQDLGEAGFPFPPFAHTFVDIGSMQTQSPQALSYTLVNQNVPPGSVLDQSGGHHAHTASVMGPLHPKNRGGRPKSDFWVFFTEQGELRGKTNRKSAKCKYCGAEIHDARVETLARHVTSECKKVDLPYVAASPPSQPSVIPNIVEGRSFRWSSKSTSVICK